MGITISSVGLYLPRPQRKSEDSSSLQIAFFLSFKKKNLLFWDAEVPFVPPMSVPRLTRDARLLLSGLF